MKKRLHKGKSMAKGSIFPGEEVGKLVRAIKKPLLTAKEEKTLARKIKKGDVAARKKLIESNLLLAIKFARRYAKKDRHLDVDDLISMAFIGLIDAADRFDPKKGARFSTYATIRMRHQVSLEIKNKESVVRIPAYLVDKAHVYARAMKNLSHELDERPTVEQIAEKMGVKKEAIMHIERSSYTIISLDRQVHANDEGEGDTFHNFIIGNDQESLDAVISRRSIQKRCLYMIEHAKLNEKEGRIIKMRFGFNDEGIFFTLQDIADELECTREYVRQIEKRALEKIKRKYGKELSNMDK